MALVKCNECGEKVSTKAKSCPACGAKAPKEKSFILRSLLLAFIAFVVYVSVTKEETNLTPAQKAEVAAMNTNPADEENAKQYLWMEKGKKAVLERLKDPNSAEFNGVYFSRGADNTPMTCGQVNSKNSFGGFVGFKRFISAGSPEFTFLEGEAKDFSSAWKKYCTK